MAPSIPFGEMLSRARGVLLAYWLLAAGGIAALTATVLALEGVPRDVSELMAFDFGCLFGLGIGNLLGLFRIRFWVNVAFSFVNGVLMAAASMSLGGGADGLFLGWIGFLFGLGCGHLCLAHRFGLAAAWLPTLTWVGSIMVYLNHYGRVSAWQAAKVTAWLPVPLALLWIFVALFLFYLAAKESHRLQLWELLGGAPWKRQMIRSKRRRVRLRGRGFAAILLLATLLFGATAILAPYLWRTGPGDREGPRRDDSQSEVEPRMKEPDFDGKALERILREVWERTQETGSTLLPFLPLFLLNRPMRRWLTLQHWRGHFFRTAPTQQVRNLWRLARVGVRDGGYRPGPGDSIQAVVEFERDRRQKLALPASSTLAQVAEIYTRVRYGLGIRPNDIAEMRTLAPQAHREARSGLTAWQRLQSWWRKELDGSA